MYEDSYNLENTHWWHRAKRELVLSLIRRFSKKSTPRILDIGAGTGKNVETFNTIGTAYGIDASDEAIRFCQKRQLTTVKKGYSSNIHFANNYFDIVTMLDVLEHTEDKQTLKEVRRVLKSGGLFIINVPAFPWLWSTWDEIAHHKRRYTKESLTQVLTKNGFSVIKISYLFSFLLVPAFIIRRLKTSMYNKTSYISDFQTSSPFNTLLLASSRIDIRVAISLGIPFGTSIFCVATKQKHSQL